MQELLKIGFGGGCHWCTEAVFMSLKGVKKVEQGFISPNDNLNGFSEAVIVYFDEKQIGLKDLIEIHLHTHKSSKNHSKRNKYRSAIYFFDGNDEVPITKLMGELQKDFTEPLITGVVPFGQFKSSEDRFHNYYFNDIDKPFCKTHISPKINLLKEKFSAHIAANIHDNAI